MMFRGTCQKVWGSVSEVPQTIWVPSYQAECAVSNIKLPNIIGVSEFPGGQREMESGNLLDGIYLTCTYNMYISVTLIITG